MKTSFKTIGVAGLALVLGAASLPSAANAGGWGHHHYYRGGSGGSAAAAGIIGFATGAIVGSALSQPRYYAPPPPPVYYQPQPVYYGAPAPWTPAWYSYCSSKYRSFNPSTGTFLGYDGRYHFCR